MDRFNFSKSHLVFLNFQITAFFKKFLTAFQIELASSPSCFLIALLSSSEILKNSLRGKDIDSNGGSDTISRVVSLETESSTSDS